MTYLVLLATLAGIAFLALSLPSIASILHTLGRGRLRARWLWLRVLIVAFIIGYAAMGIIWASTSVLASDLVVAAILSAGGAFVLIVTRLSDMTTGDIMRISALERDVIRDPLTGLFNRRYLDAKLDEETGRSCKWGTPLSTLLIDLDHFKHINDTYGHAVGDQVIRHVSALLAGRVGADDTVVRYGGEEFLILAPNRDIDECAALGERIRHDIAGDPLWLTDGRELPVTASLGAATFTVDESPARLLKRADDALYRAKRSGRNRLCRAVGTGDALAV